ncbi:ABC transporter ATP-binding protein [Tessaracoccus caeni]|uniref:ABC transporter ATP-binding protein n=1 Tax=Tessaracoccus caeni TaxID=3031239 RepID=UPI0023DB6E6C|nr:ABC transporter ATP-binding protein [Tessaracoccus caeni]MDF1487381.1 ABC transporter ATP-binding protein [Tessaracoccus caeni]
MTATRHDAPWLEVDDLTIEVRGTGKRLVDGISFQLARGERLGIIGESGSGKSVTSLALLGLLPPTLRASGSARVSGHQVIGVRESELRAVRGGKVALVFQDPSTALDPLTRIGALIAEPLRRHRALTGAAAQDAIRQLLQEVSLPERVLRAFPHELSGGQRQRVAIAMALACGAETLIADEPTTALDVTVQAEILGLLRKLSDERGMALVLVSHDIAVVSATVDRALVMRYGSIVEEGPIDTIVRSPQHEYTQRLVAGARALDRALTTGTIDTGRTA